MYQPQHPGREALSNPLETPHMIFCHRMGAGPEGTERLSQGHHVIVRRADQH